MKIAFDYFVFNRTFLHALKINIIWQFAVTVTLTVLIGGCSGISYKKDSLPIQKAPFKTIGISKSIKVKPEVRENGIFFGDKSLVLDKKGMMTLMSGGRKIGDFFFYFSTPYSPWITTSSSGLKNSKWNVDTAKNKYIFTADIPMKKKNTDNMPYGHYLQTVKVLEDGKIKVEMEYSVPDKFEKKLKGAYMFFRMPFTICQGKSYKINKKDYIFSEISGSKGLNVYYGRPQSFIFTPDNPETKFSIEIGKKQCFFIKDRKNSIISCGIVPYKKTRKVSFTLDLTEIAASSLKKSSDCHAGIDFWKNDRLHVPDFSKNINLIQNPSFESGLRYYTLHDTWGVYKKSPTPIYSIDTSHSKFGNSSLLITTQKNNPKEGFLQTFAIPVKTGKKYTVSLYAKGNKIKGLRLFLQSITAKWPVFPRIGSCSVGLKWKRYAFTFTAPNNAVTILLKGNYKGSDASGKIWVDGIQLEENDKATKYTEKPLYAYLKTSNPDNFLNLKEKINAELKIVTTPNTEGSVKCKISDFFYRKTWQGNFTFKRFLLTFFEAG